MQFRVVEYEWKHWPQEFLAEFPVTGEREVIPFAEVAAIRRCPEQTATAPPAGAARSREGEGEGDEFVWPDERDEQVS